MTMSRALPAGEFALIRDFFSSGFPRSRDTVLGVGDDCSVVVPRPLCDLVQSIDTQVADVHFPADAPADLIAQRALRCAASDLAAMGAEPQGFHLALTLPSADGHWLAAFSRSLREAADALNLDLLGGDTTRGQHLVISISVQGWVTTGTALTRSGARPGDDVWVSGSIGTAALALPQVLANPADYSGLAHAYYFPDVQLPLGQALNGMATACMDISDGLLQDAAHIARASNVSLHLNADAIPTAVRTEDARWQQCLSGGDDYQLLFTAPVSRRREVQNLGLGRTAVTRIGEVQPATTDAIRLLRNGQVIPLPAHAGFQHF